MKIEEFGMNIPTFNLGTESNSVQFVKNYHTASYTDINEYSSTMKYKNNGVVFETQNHYGKNLLCGKKEHIEDFDDNDMILDETKLNNVENIIYNTNNWTEGSNYNKNDSKTGRNNYQHVSQSLPQLPTYSYKSDLKNCALLKRITKKQSVNEEKNENNECETDNSNESKCRNFFNFELLSFNFLNF